MDNNKQQPITEQHENQSQVSVQKKPVGYFRWQGFAGFVVTLSLIGGLLVVFAGPLIKAGIEHGGSWYWGAEVNVAKVDVDWSPFKLSVNQFEATDPQTPSQNLVAFEQADVSVDLFQAMLGKTLIKELVINKVELNKQRKSPGEVTVVPGEGDSADTGVKGAIKDAVGSLPSAEDILKQANLKTIKAGNQLQQTYQTEKAAIDALRKDLPDQQQLDVYRQAVKKISDAKANTPAELAALKAEFDKLKKRFKQDKAALTKAKDQLKNSKANIGRDLKALKEAPAQDWQDLSERYQLNDAGAQNFAELIFGPKAREYYQIAKDLYVVFQPMLAKLNAGDKTSTVEVDLEKGRYIHFDEQNPLPDWLVEKTHISMNLDQGGFAIEIDEMTSQHWIRNKPTVLRANSNNLLGKGSLVLNGNMKVAEQGTVTANADWTVQGVALSNLPISHSDQLTLELTKAKLDFHGKLVLTNERLENKNKVSLSQADFDGTAQSKAGEVTLAILSDLKNLTIGIDAIGDPSAPQFKVSSALDKQVYGAVKKQVSAKVKRFKDETQAGLQQKLASQLKLQEGDANELVAIASDFDNLDKALNDLLKSKLGNKLKDSIKDKLKDLF
jgi:uncharacterized protein (TIGR03545 family)